MLYTATVIVLADTAKNTPKVQELGIAKGIISWVSVLFPPGCNGMVYCTISYKEHQIAPSTEMMALTGNGTPVEWSEYYEAYQPDYKLKIKAWSPGTTYDHAISVRVAILPRKGVIATAVSDTIANILSIFSPKRIVIGED